MTSDRRFELDLPLILDDLSMAPYPDYIDDVLALAAHRRQRPWWMSLQRWLPMELVSQRVLAPRTPWRALGVAALVLVLIVKALLAAGGQRRLPPPFGPAANGVIPYAAGGDLYIGDPVTGSTRLLLGGPTNDVEPIFSRDGDRIGFLRLHETDASVVRLFIMNVDGSSLVDVAGPISSISWFDWTGDGRLIVSRDHALGFTIYDPIGGTAPVTLAADYLVNAPMLRPGGDEVVFRGRRDNQLGIYTIKLDGAELRALVGPRATVNEEFELKAPRYSPDGTMIAFHEWDTTGPTGVMRQYVMNADGSGRRELGADPAYWLTAWAVWSNDSTRIAVQRGLDTPDGQPEIPQPHAIIDIRDGSIIETGPPFPADGARVEWAPDDSVILMVPNAEGLSAWLLDPAGGPWRVTAWTTNSYPSWQRLAASGR
jgi:hypothetical protein